MKFPKLPKFMDKKNVSKMLENKYVLYFVFILAIINLFGYMITGNFNSIIFFVLVGFLTTFFSKNMILILTVPLVLTSVLMVGKTVKESFENASENDAIMKKYEEFNKNIKNINNTIYDLQEKLKVAVDSKEVKDINTAIEQNKNKLKLTQNSKDNFYKRNKSIIQSETTKRSTSEPTSTTTTPTTTTTTPNTPTTSEPMSSMYNKPNRIDYASTVEDAYDDLNKILGGNGIKQLTDDTQKLMQQQLQLADAMKSMSPLMEQAKGLLQGFDLKNLSSLTNVSKNLQMPVDGN
jgi:hypothetical protein